MPEEFVRNNLESVLESIIIVRERFEAIESADDFMKTPEGVTKLDAISMRLQIIGELLKKIDKLDANYLVQFKEVDWNKIIKMRDLISHHYDSINPVVIYDVCKNHIPILKTTIEKILKEYNK